jgi:hypothetical protein
LCSTIFGDGLGEVIEDVVPEFKREGVKHMDEVGEEGQDADPSETSANAPLTNN